MNTFNFHDKLEAISIWGTRKVPRPSSNDMALVFELMEGPTLHESWYLGKNLKSISGRMFSGDLLGFHGIFNGICWDFSKKHWDQMGLTMQLVDPIRHGYLQENRNHRNTGCPKCLVQYHLVPKISEWHFWGKKSILLNINEYHHFASLSDSHFFGGVRPHVWTKPPGIALPLQKHQRHHDPKTSCEC